MPKRPRCETCNQFLQDCQCKMQTCTNCGKEYKETSYAGLCRAILQHEPSCGLECNKVLGYVKETRRDNMALAENSAYTVSHYDVPIPKPLLPVFNLLEKLDCQFLKFRWSRSHVPHIVLQFGANTFSICYFGHDKFYRIFHPYPGESPARRDLATPEEVIDFIKAKEALECRE